MRVPVPPTPASLPAWAAIIIMGCLLVALAALWFVIVTGKMIVLAVSALALLVAGGCAMAYWPRTS